MLEAFLLNLGHESKFTFVLHSKLNQFLNQVNFSAYKKLFENMKSVFKIGQ